MAEFAVPSNPVYNPTMRQVEFGDPARATLLNNMFAQVIENVEAVRLLASGASQQVTGLEAEVEKRAAKAESAALIASIGAALFADDMLLDAIGSSATPAAWYAGTHTALAGKLLVPVDSVTESAQSEEASAEDETPSGGVTDTPTDIGGTESTVVQYVGLSLGWMRDGVFYTVYNADGSVSDPFAKDGRWLLQDAATGSYYDYSGTLNTTAITALDGAEQIVTPTIGKFYRVGTVVYVWASGGLAEVDIQNLRNTYTNLRAELDAIQATLASLVTAFKAVFAWI